MSQASTTSQKSDAPAQQSLASDPQFWIVTIIAIAALIFILRALLPKLGLRRAKGVSTRAELTIERRKP
jgi:hypothetical protein